MNFRHTTLALSIALGALAVSATPAQAQAATPTASAAASVNMKAVVGHYGALVHATYSDTLAATRDMQSAIAAFVKTPSADTLAAARTSWLGAREF